ncbi:MAG: UDP-2,3-diacylglucosamine diphosphatase [Betaproteobacteria bacterium RIFCSPLOWO2_12_FULL_62_13]|nr:MAG: UDP-2,3-diacylglucosamine diphosphatase [Betaproteobacteria bacterium RIFCSPLOWO2_12_FULL_62_13]
MATHFISDLHLAAERPHIIRQFFDFLEGTASQAEALYVLGDLFEYWVGDDDLDDPFNTSVADALRRLSDRGVALYLMHGNRDVLLGQDFVRRCGTSLITDPLLLDLYGTRTLVMHGDTLCTDDVDYQKFRAYARNPANQAKFLAQPLAARKRQMAGLRAASEEHKHEVTLDIMDVSVAAVDQTLRDFGYPRLIHGHTHRPARHVHVVDGHECERWVLNDWYKRGGYLRCTRAGCSAELL